MASFHAIKYDLLKDNLSNQVNFVDSYESILEALEGAPLSNEVEETIQNIKTKIDDSKVIITNLKKTITEIDDLKDKFKDQLEVPKSGNNKKFNMEHLLISVPQFDDTNEKIPFQHFFKKLTCFARNNSLTHEAIKQCLDIVLKANAFDIYDFVRQEPLSKVISILSDHFGSITNLDDDIRKLASIKRKPEQKVQSFMAEVSLLLLKTESLTDPQARDQRYESKMKEHLFQACSETAKNKLDNFMAEAIRNGIRPTYKELFHIVKEHEREQQYSQHQDIANYTLMLTRNKNKNKNNDDLSSNTYRETSYSPSEASYQSSRRSSRSSRSTRPEPSSYQIHEARFITERRPNLLENRQAQVFTDANGIKWVKKKEQQDHLISEDEDTYKDNRINEKPHQIKTKLHTTDQHYDRDRSPLRTPTEYLNTNEKPPQEIQHQRDSQPKNQYEIIPPPKTEKIPVRISRPSSINSRGPSPIASSTNSTPSRRSSTSESQSPQKMSVITNFFPHLYHGVETIKCKSCGEVHYLISGCKNPKSAHTLLLSCLKQDPNNYDVRNAYYTNLPNSINGENGNYLQNDICSDQSEEDSEMSDDYTESQDTDSDTEMNSDTQPIHYEETTSNENRPSFLTKEEFNKHKAHAHEYCGLISHKVENAKIEKNNLNPNINTLYKMPFGALAAINEPNNPDCQQIRAIIPLGTNVAVATCCSIDTGSDICLINNSFLRTFPSAEFKKEPYEATYATLSPKLATVKQAITLPLQIGNKEHCINFKIMEDTTLPFQIILGKDFLQKHVKKIDFESNNISLRDVDELVELSNFTTSAGLTSAESIYLPPQGTTTMKTRLDPGELSLLEDQKVNISPTNSSFEIKTKELQHKNSKLHDIKITNYNKKIGISISYGDPIGIILPLHVKKDVLEDQPIRNFQTSDLYCNKIKERLPDSFKIKDGILIKTIDEVEKWVLPKDLLVEFVELNHDVKHHRNRSELLEVLHKEHYRPDMGKVVRALTKNCELCLAQEEQDEISEPIGNIQNTNYEKYPSLKRKYHETHKRNKRHKSANKQTRQPHRPFFHLGEVAFYRYRDNYDGPYEIRHISRSIAFLRHVFNKNKTLKCHLSYLLKSI